MCAAVCAWTDAVDLLARHHVEERATRCSAAGCSAVIDTQYRRRLAARNVYAKKEQGQRWVSRASSRRSRVDMSLQRVAVITFVVVDIRVYHGEFAFRGEIELGPTRFLRP